MPTPGYAISRRGLRPATGRLAQACSREVTGNAESPLQETLEVIQEHGYTQRDVATVGLAEMRACLERTLNSTQEAGQWLWRRRRPPRIYMHGHAVMIRQKDDGTERWELIQFLGSYEGLIRSGVQPARSSVMIAHHTW